MEIRESSRERFSTSLVSAFGTLVRTTLQQQHLIPSVIHLRPLLVAVHCFLFDGRSQKAFESSPRTMVGANAKNSSGVFICRKSHDTSGENSREGKFHGPALKRPGRDYSRKEI